MVATWVLRAAHAGLFGLAAVACLGSLPRLSRIEDPDTRRGLGALLLLSAGWATAQAGHVLASRPAVAAASYTLGLVAGLATVGAWLYFCSAYAGRTYHRSPRYRRAAVATYLAVVAFKLTNPWHGLYFQTAVVGTPFPHLAIREGAAFWVVAGLAYVLSGVGVYMLLEVFEDSRTAPRAAVSVVLLAALPVVLDVVGYLSPAPILGLNYESVGVGLFAIGALYVVREPFFAVSRYGRVQLVDRFEDAVLITDADGRVRDYNDAAVGLFPALAGGGTPRLADLADGVDLQVLTDGGTIELERAGETRSFIVRTLGIDVGATEIGRGIVCTDVTEIERQRRELRRKDEQLEGLARAISHELRNSVSIISGQAELVSRATSGMDDPEVDSRVATILEETADIERIVDELKTLARYSQRIAETTRVDLEDVARSAHRRVDAEALKLAVERSVVVVADRERLRELFEHAFRFAAACGASRVVVRGSDGGFAVEGDGRTMEAFDEEELFAYGNAVPDPDVAMLLPNVRTLASAHGWSVSVEPGTAGGTKLEVTGVTTEQPTG